MGERFRFLFTPTDVGPVTLANRIAFSPHGHGYVEHDPKLGCEVGGPGYYGERCAYYLAERAKQGTGLIIVGGAAVHPTAAYECHHILANIWDKNCVPGLKLVTSAVHDAGAKIFLQLMHGGNQCHGVQVSRHPIWSASDIPTIGTAGLGGEVPKAVEIEDIQELVEYYGRCAENAREAGMDGVEIHGGTDYLPHQFHSPLYNKRTDQYGGPLENRLRFTMEVIDKVKSAIGDRMALGYRLTTEDYIPGGLGIEEMKQIAKALEATGKVDYIHINPGIRILIGQTMYDAHVPLKPYLATLKETVSIPVIANMRIVDPTEGEQLLADGHADIISMCRALIADPEFANKAREGRVEEIRYCVGCNQLCLGNALRDLPIACSQNPAAGREKEWGIGTIRPAATKKKVIVIGGGPAGMEAAWVAAARGHDVTLYEKKAELGGQVNLAVKLPGRSESEDWSRWRKTMLSKYGVRIMAGKEVAAEDVIKENPDAVVVATGSSPRRDGLQGVTGYPVPGWDLPNVMTVDEVLEGREVQTNKVLILDEEAHIKGPGVAEMLAGQGKQVEIVFRDAWVGSNLEMMTRVQVTQRLLAKGVILTPFYFPVNIEENKVTLINIMTQEVRVVEGPMTVILNMGRKANDTLYFALKGKVKELYRVGDCVAPRLVSSATYEGHKVGREI